MKKGKRCMKKLVSTLGISKEEWLKYRKQGIGGSDAAAVCGLNPYSSPMKVFYDKTGNEIETYDNEAMRQGRDLEEYVAKRFTEATGLKVRRANAICYDEVRPYMLADVDRLIVGENAGLECKTVSPYNWDKWQTGKVPLHYQVQCYHYMSVFKTKAWYIAALIFGKELVIKKFEWDDMIIKSIRTIEQNFWENHVEKKILPAPDGSEVAEKMIKESFQNLRTDNSVPLEGFRERLERREELANMIAHMEKEKKQIEQEVKIFMGEAETDVACGEGYFITWKDIATNRLDEKRLKQEMPDIYSQYQKSCHTRRLMIKTQKTA